MRVVFDTNIVASASYWRGNPFACLAAWSRHQFTAFVSPQVLSEYFETCEELSRRYPGRKRVAWAEHLTSSAELVFPHERIHAGPDPDDEIFLECAVAANADYLVSGDKKHLLSLRRVRGVKIISAADFLAQL